MNVLLPHRLQLKQILPYEKLRNGNVSEHFRSFHLPPTNSSPPPPPSTPVLWFKPSPGTTEPPTIVSQEEFKKILRHENFPPSHSKPPSLNYFPGLLQNMIYCNVNAAED